MTNETQALVPRPTSLPAAIERRTQIANRLLGELTRRDTEGFFRRHLEFFRLVASRHYPLDEALLDRYADRWEWGWLGLSENEGLPWSEALLDRYADRWDWGRLSWNAGLPWSEALLDRYADRWAWWSLSGNEGLPWSEALLDRYADRWDWGRLSWNKALPWSEALIDRYADRWDWGGLSGNAALPWSEALLDRYADRWDWKRLSGNAGLPWSAALIDRSADRWDWREYGGLSWNAALPWSEALLDRYADRWHWGGLSLNAGLPWSAALIDRYADDRWDWREYGLSKNTGLSWSEVLLDRYADRWNWNRWGLSGNAALPWSEALLDRNATRWDWEASSAYAALPWSAALIDRYADRRDWWRLSGNAALPWSYALYERFAERWKIVAVASHYDGNVRSLTPEQVDRLMCALVDAWASLGLPADAWVSIPGDEFLMGSPESEEGRGDNERPYCVLVATFQMLKTPVTFAMFDAFCAATGREPPEDEGWGGADRPVINVSYWDAVDYADWLSERTGRACRLPTEAEWEYACRAGTTTAFWTGETLTTEQANYAGESAYGSGPEGVCRRQTTPVRLFPPNPWGLHDMHGNVWEWCASAYDADYTLWAWNDASCDRANDGPRSLRGGSWFNLPAWVRSAARSRNAPTYRGYHTGFRLARSF